MTFDPNKPVQRRDGLPARIICIDAKNEEPIIALHLQDGREVVWTHVADGRWFSGREHPADLVNVPETVTTWQNVYANGDTGGGYSSRERADDAAFGIPVLRIAVLVFRTTDDVTTVSLESAETSQ